MKEIIAKINWRKVITIAGCVVTGVMAFADAFGEHKQAAKILDLETRLANLESK